MRAGSILGKSSHLPAYGQARFHQLVKSSDSNANCVFVSYWENIHICLQQLVKSSYSNAKSECLRHCICAFLNIIIYILYRCILLHSIICTVVLPSPCVPDTAFVKFSHCCGTAHLSSSHIVIMHGEI